MHQLDVACVISTTKGGLTSNDIPSRVDLSSTRDDPSDKEPPTEDWSSGDDWSEGGSSESEG
jgi:hypothetical protein